MEFEDLIVAYSYLSLVIWASILAWCAVSFYAKAKKEKEWEQGYKPTLQSGLDERAIGSYTTIREVRKEKSRPKPRQRKSEQPF